MKRKFIFCLVITMVLLSACAPKASKRPHPQLDGNYVSVTFSFDQHSSRAAATLVDSLGTQVLEDAADSATLLPLSDTSLSVTNVIHGGKRYISATFEVENNTGAGLANLYFLAADPPASPLFKNVEAFDGSSVPAPDSMEAAHAYVFDSVSNAMVVAPYSDYVTGLDIVNADLTDSTSVLDYGFLAQNIDRTSTVIPAGAKGRVTFAVELDDLTGSSQDPFKFSMTFYMAQDVDPVLETAGCTTVITCIHDIQGADATPPLLGDEVTIDAIVTAVYPGLNGFFVQEEDTDADADVATSEGIFVYQNAEPTVSIGDRVEVSGTVGEFRKFTQLSSPTITVVSSDNILPTPASVTLPVPNSMTIDAFYEQFEGMLTQFTDQLTVTEYYQLARFGELVLSQGGRLRQYTDVDATPTSLEYTVHLDDNARRSIILEDDRTGDNVFLGGNTGDDPSLDTAYSYPEGGFSINNYLRGGDTIDNLTVITTYFENTSGSFKAWQFRPIYSEYDYTFEKSNARSATPPSVGESNVKVASFNVLNYFTTLGSRGADSTSELRRQEAKIVAAICALDADVVGLVEIENDADRSLNNLVSALNNGVDADGDGTDDVPACAQPYSAVETGTIGSDEITVAFIYRPDTVSLQGDFATLTSADFLRPEGGSQDRNRPALAQTFSVNSNGGVFTVVTNHLKSKGGTGSGNDADQGDGQANYNASRTGGAEALVDWLATDPTGSGDTDVLIMGDLNAYRYEDPIEAIRDGSDDVRGTPDDFVDLVTAADTSLYSYVFSGQVGFLDHALASSSLNTQVTGATIWNINADEVSILDYNDGIQDAGERWFRRKSTALPIYEPSVYRASDHDPVLVGLNVTPTGADIVSPTVAAFSPADDASNVPPLSSLEITFSEDIEAVAGTITIDAAPSASITVRETIETIAIPSSQVVVDGSKVTINLANPLPVSSVIDVNLLDGFQDLAGNPLAGLFSWSFTTAAEDTTPPSVVSLKPANNLMTVPVGANLKISFDENIQKADGVISIYRTNDAASPSEDVLVESIAVSDASVVVSGSSVTITPTNDFLEETDYFVTISSGAFQDVVGNAYAGLVKGEWGFRTVAPSTGTGSITELFFSEYIEGSSQNKALEIFNGTGADIDLSDYSIVRYNNVSTEPTAPGEEALSGTILNNGVFVIANANANADILAVADISTGSFTFFSGDDVVVLMKGSTVVDVIGQIGNRPVGGWGTGDTSTAEHTLRRKPTVCSGDTDPNDAFDPAIEWDGFPQNNSDDLGQYVTSC